jgi:hypothetical protein
MYDGVERWWLMMAKKKDALVTHENLPVDETALFDRVSAIIENRKYRAAAYANQEITMMFWEVGNDIRSTVLEGERAKYGKQIVVTLSQQLVARYGKSFGFDNIRRMMRFAEKFSDFAIVAPLAPQLSWSHFIEIVTVR